MPRSAKDINKLVIKDTYEIELDGILYILPNRYLPNLDLAIEHQIIFKNILAKVIHYHRNKISLNCLSKTHIDKFLVITEKIFAYCLTGYLNDTKFMPWEQNIINEIPISIMSKLNPFIAERIL